MNFRNLKCILFSLGSFWIHGQNLVPNPSFEDTILCSSITNANQLPASDWLSFNTADYYNNMNTCGAGWGGGRSVPNNFAGHQYPHSGNAYTGIGVYGTVSSIPNYREWLQVQLNDTLQAGKTYCISFFYSQADNVRYSIDKIGAYLSATGITLTGNSFTQYNAQVFTPANLTLNDTSNWKKCQGSLTAQGGEKYLAVGNFFDDSQTNAVLSYPGNTSPFSPSYYYIDDVSVLPIDLTCTAGKDTSVCKNDSIYIGRPPESGLDNVWTEITTGSQVGVGAGIWLKPDTSATYVVTQNLCGTTSTDTVRVVVNCIDGVIKYSNSFIQTYPNPVRDILNIECRFSAVTIIITDILGNKLREELISEKAVLAVEDLKSGVYILQIRAENKLLVSKFIKD